MKTNTRVIRVKGDNLVLGPKAISDGETLCDYCGAFSFCNRNKDAVQCNHLIPPIAFTNPVGLEAGFSTLRLGMAWHQRLTIARHIALYDGSKQELIGIAKVHDVVTGDLDTLIALTADTNHTFLGRDIEDKEAALRRVIRNHYGSNFAAGDRLATAIYCERLHGEEYSRLQETWKVGRKRQRRGRQAAG